MLLKITWLKSVLVSTIYSYRARLFGATGINFVIFSRPYLVRSPRAYATVLRLSVAVCRLYGIYCG